MADKKGMAAMIVAKMAPKKGPEADVDADHEGKVACAEDMMRALDEKDTKAFMSALDAYLDQR